MSDIPWWTKQHKYHLFSPLKNDVGPFWDACWFEQLSKCCPQSTKCQMQGLKCLPLTCELEKCPTWHGKNIASSLLPLLTSATHLSIKTFSFYKTKEYSWKQNIFISLFLFYNKFFILSGLNLEKALCNKMYTKFIFSQK